MNYPQRMYSKTELGLLYFPDTTDGATARRHIMVWIKRCEPGGKRKTARRFFLRLAVLIFHRIRT